jgi:hypothetical protein
MDRIILTISSDLFDDTNQEASVRKNLPVRSLITDIQREFSLPEGNYSLSLKGSSKPLDPEKTLEQLGIQTGVELLFGRERRKFIRPIAVRGGGTFRMIMDLNQAFLREDSTGKIFEIEWQPAIIGRPDASNPQSADTLCADLSAFEEARSVSRQHARITELKGQYYLEGLAEKNPTYLNEQEIMVGEKRSLKAGDKIRVGKIMLTFGLRVTQKSQPLASG